MAEWHTENYKRKPPSVPPVFISGTSVFLCLGKRSLHFLHRSGLGSDRRRRRDRLDWSDLDEGRLGRFVHQVPRLLLLLDLLLRLLLHLLLLLFSPLTEQVKTPHAIAIWEIKTKRQRFSILPLAWLWPSPAGRNKNRARLRPRAEIVPGHPAGQRAASS